MNGGTVPTALAGARVCLVSSGPLGSNPRLVKEANALHQAGCDVRVVATDATGLETVRLRTEDVLRSAPWRFEPVPTGGVFLRRSAGVLRRIARTLAPAGWEPVDRLAYNPWIGRMAATAGQQPADLFIAHNLAALPAAAAAAARHGARLGFDAEDFHSGELADGPHTHGILALTRRIEAAYLPRCDHLSAASPGIARAYAETLGTPPAVVILNVFERALAPPAPPSRAAGRPTIYWFSQTVGPDRGLENAIRGISLSRSRPLLRLRGSVSPDYREHLAMLAGQGGARDCLEFLPPAPPSRMVELAKADLGLASETLLTRNRQLCLSNKLFTYLLAGTPVLCSHTEAQADFCAQVPEAAFLYPQDDPPALAAIVDDLLGDPVRLDAARCAAWRYGQDTYNWETHQTVLLEAVARCLATTPGAARRRGTP